VYSRTFENHSQKIQKVVVFSKCFCVGGQIQNKAGLPGPDNTKAIFGPKQFKKGQILKNEKRTNLQKNIKSMIISFC